MPNGRSLRKYQRHSDLSERKKKQAPNRMELMAFRPCPTAQAYASTKGTAIFLKEKNKLLFACFFFNETGGIYTPTALY